jgi:phosphoribosylanthranilate isomerase
MDYYEVNGVDMREERFSEYATNLKAVMESVPEVEFIIQLNSETRKLFDLIACDPPSNMSVLFDSSCGQGIEITVLPAQPADIPCGYAGGIGPENISLVLEMVMDQSEYIRGSKPVWIDMESSLRVAQSDRMVLDQDVFSIDKCFACIKMGVFFGLPVSRFTILTI